MKDEPKEKQNPRRNVIKTVLSTTALGTAVLPTKWTRPVIDAVLLPAHAQTSEVSTTTTASPTTTTASPTTTTASPTTTTTQAPMCNDLTAPGRTLSCGDPAGINETISYGIDDSGSCPLLVMSMDGFSVVFSTVGYIPSITISSDQLVFNEVLNCEALPTPSVSDFVIPFTSTSGAAYRVTGTIEKAFTTDSFPVFALILSEMLITKL